MVVMFLSFNNINCKFLLDNIDIFLRVSIELTAFSVACNWNLLLITTVDQLNVLLLLSDLKTEDAPLQNKSSGPFFVAIKFYISCRVEYGYSCFMCFFMHYSPAQCHLTLSDIICLKTLVH